MPGTCGFAFCLPRKRLLIVHCIQYPHFHFCLHSCCSYLTCATVWLNVSLLSFKTPAEKESDSKKIPCRPEPQARAVNQLKGHSRRAWLGSRSRTHPAAGDPVPSSWATYAQQKISEIPKYRIRYGLSSPSLRTEEFTDVTQLDNCNGKPRYPET